MTDDPQKKGYDPANTSPAEGQSHPIPGEDRGQAPNEDPAAKDQPAEGGRDEVPGPGADLPTTTRD
ncbi:hypothetical protein DEIPH_ctg012orf0024 [Deinococcus phoenicis]|uniref:Uncharacterized protein n=1 Tax=Deinococcus phoenicis TaxID=1476583 RepID=A0A016QS53_9DEIO|nr:hypothetical protein [Deinococcus phoenicis]EYB68965.1 hypothetical protein DEIPH_ctg012orf0024 [Deinococcus phoenicis]